MNDQSLAAVPKAPVSPVRQLVLHTMLSLLAAVAVFVVLSWLIIVPQLARQEVRIRAFETRIEDLEQAADEAEEAAQAAAAPAAPAGAPAGTAASAGAADAGVAPGAAAPAPAAPSAPAK